MSTWNLVVLALVTVGLLKIFKPLLFLFAFLKTQFRRPALQVVEPVELGEEVLAYLATGAQPLVELGFSPLGYVRAQTFEHTEYGELPMLVLAHDETGAVAEVCVAGAGNALRINYYAELDDGSRIETVHGESTLLIGSFPRTDVVDSPSADVRELWKVFAARLESACRTRTVRRLDIAQHAEVRRQWYDALIAAWLADGTLQPAAEPDRFELTLRRAWFWAWRMESALKEHAKFTQSVAALQPAAPMSEQIRGYQKTREFSTRRSTRWRWTSFLAVTAVVFAVSMLRIVEPQDVLALVTVVLIHELGHYAAMRLLGYRDTSIFFIPFFGAAARGVKNDERAHEQVAVLLAGPMPGILIGVALPFVVPQIDASPLFKSLPYLFVIINVFNLVPIFPLDGGRIVQVLFGTLPPWVEVAFKALSALALLALGVLSWDPVLIAVSILLLVGARTAKRAADAVKRIRAQGPVPATEDARLALVFDELARNQPSLPPRMRHAVVLPVSDRLRQAPLRALGVVTWSGAYVACSVVGVAAVAVVALRVPGLDSKAPLVRPLACDQIDTLQERGDGSYLLQCSMRDRATLRELSDSLESFSSLAHSQCLRAPWDEQPVSASEVLARKTVALLAEEQRRAFGDEYTNPRAPGGARRTDGQFLVAAKAAARSACEALIEQHRDDPAFDREAASLFMTDLAKHDADDVAAAGDSGEDERVGQPDAELPAECAALVQKLGVRSARCHTDSVSVGHHVRMKDGAIVLAGFDEHLEEVLPQLSRFLCTAGCELRYWTATDARPGR